MPTTIILLTSASGVMQALLLAGILYFHPRSDRSVTGFLALHIITISLFMLMPVVECVISWQTIVLLVPFQFLIGPFLYLYVRSFKATISWPKVWPHFVLFAIVMSIDLLHYYPWVLKYPSSEKAPPEVLLAPLTMVIVITRNFQMLTYYFLTREALSQYQRSIQSLYSETSKVNLNWVRWLLNGYLLLIITVFPLFYLVVNNPGYFSLYILINTALITPYIYAVAIRGIGQPTLWQVQPGTSKERIEKELNETEAIVTHVKKNGDYLLQVKGISEIKLQEFISRITFLMENVKLYREPDLTLQGLSDKLEIPSCQASQLINEGLKKSFYDLINGYRVEEAKRLLMDEKSRNFTILSVGFEAGFNSKTTFNTVFKKFTGFTPTEYRNKQGTAPVSR